MKIKTDLYLTYIRKALESKAITTDQYSAAAQIIVKAYLAS